MQINASIQNASVHTPTDVDTVAGSRDTPSTSGTVDTMELLQSKALIEKSAGEKSAAAGLQSPKEGAPAPSTANTLKSLSDDQVSTDIYAFMALFQKIAQSMRDTARTQRATELEAQTSELLNAAQEMREAAASRFNAAIVQGTFQIVSGAAQIAASSVSLAKSAKAGSKEFDASASSREAESATDAAKKLELQETASELTKQSKAAGAAASFAHDMGQASNGIITGAGGILSGWFSKEGGDHDATSAEAQARAKVHETAAQQASDQMQQMMDVIRDIRDKLQAIQQSAVETNRSIARNI
jgi:thiaminase